MNILSFLRQSSLCCLSLLYIRKINSARIAVGPPVAKASIIALSTIKPSLCKHFFAEDAEQVASYQYFLVLSDEFWTDAL